jgi:hypothetical protein
VQRLGLEQPQRRLHLAEVAPGTGDHDGQLDLAGLVEVLADLRGVVGECLLRTSQGALAVGHHRCVVLLAVHPASGAQLGQRLGELAGRVGRLAAGLTDQAVARRAGPGREGVLVRGLGVLVHEQAGHHEVTGHPLGELFRDRLQGLAGLLVEVLGADVVGDRRAVVGLLVDGALRLGPLRAAPRVRPAIAITVAAARRSTVPRGFAPAGGLAAPWA